MLTSILFDLDETLIDRGATMKGFLIKQHGRFPELLNCESHMFVNAVLQYQNNGYADKRVAYQSALADLKQESKLINRLMDDFESTYGTESVLFPGTHEVLGALGREYKIGLVSNGRSIGQRNKIRSAELESFLDAVVISEEVGIKKPDPRIFLQCLELLSTNANEAGYVGDNPVNDIEPAMKLGMKSIWIRNSRYSPPNESNAMVSSISELPRAIGELCSTNS